MRSAILQTATRYMLPLLLLFSVVVLLQGHNKPGGGFIGGLVASAAFALHAITFGAFATRQALRISLPTLIGAGLLMALVSGLIGPVLSLFSGLASGDLGPDNPPLAVMTGVWTELDLPALGEVKLGTPLLFDLGVYAVVLGVVMMFVLPLLEDEPQ